MCKCDTFYEDLVDMQELIDDLFFYYRIGDYEEFLEDLRKNFQWSLQVLQN